MAQTRPEFGNATINAGLREDTDLKRALVINHFLVKRLPFGVDYVLPMHRLDDLLGRKSNSHADYDNPDFAEELAPAVERLWQMEMHGLAPCAEG